jgi:hypothetical protein
MRGQAVAKRQAARPEQYIFTDPDLSTTKKEKKIQFCDFFLNCYL